MRKLAAIEARHPLVVGTLVFYVLVLLLNAGGLRKQAELMPYGTMRSVCVATISPVARVSDRLGITLLRKSIEEWVNEHTGGLNEY